MLTIAECILDLLTEAAKHVRGLPSNRQTREAWIEYLEGELKRAQRQGAITRGLACHVLLDHHSSWPTIREYSEVERTRANSWLAKRSVDFPPNCNTGGKSESQIYDILGLKGVPRETNDSRD